MQALERSKPLFDLPELHFDGTQPIIHATQIGPHPGDLHTQRDDGAGDDADDPLSVSTRHSTHTTTRHGSCGRAGRFLDLPTAA